MSSKDNLIKRRNEGYSRLRYTNLPSFLPDFVSKEIQITRERQWWIYCLLTLLVALTFIAGLAYNEVYYVVSPIIALFAIILFLVGVLGEQQIVFDNEKLFIPGQDAISQWSALKKIDIEESQDKKSGNYLNLVLHFTMGVTKRLNLSKMEPEALQCLLEAVETHAPNCKTGPLYNKLDLFLSDHAITTLPLEYTQLWELDRRGVQRTTSYSTLNSGDSLQNERYIVESQIGCGGLAAIYHIKNSSGEDLILKEAFTPESASSTIKEKAAQMFAREAKILAALDHPKIVKIFDHFIENDRHYLVLEYIKGIDLRSYVTRFSKVEESKIIGWTKEMVDILSYLHKRKPAVIHRDITPENIILTDSNTIKLIDFGTMQEYLSTITGTIVGKHAYMAPEQFKGQASIKSDTYSLGCTLHFLSTATDPNPLSIQHPRDLEDSLSKNFDDLVSSLTQISQDDRPNTEELSKLLENLSTANETR